MYLKTLEMVGFKSFAERTKVDFAPGMMAIVGPNGCGKSNVSDAIRWVLGEQSAKALRGGAMTDVIFNGTDGARPLNMAEVSLTLTDCESTLGTEYHEVTVTRRVFRTGEGQYLLNKTPCRLRDIQRLFMDTGLGTSSYSVMEQGRIDQILSSRPDDRREVFEEASGISKYKADKKEAIRKLEHTDANLLRLGDIIKEVRRQMISLQRQVGKARRYKSIQEQLRSYDLWLARTRLGELDAALAEATASRDALAAREAELQAFVTRDDEAASALRQQLATLETDIAAALDASSAAAGALERTRESIRVNQERAKELEALSQRDSRETETARATLETHRAEAATLKSDMAALETELAGAGSAWTERQSALAAHDKSISDARAAVSNLRSDYMGLEAASNRAQNEWNDLEAKERSDLIRKERCTGEKADAERAVAAYAEQVAALEARRAEKAAAVQSATDALTALRAAQNERRAALVAARETASKASHDVAAREAQVALLARTQAQARGFPEGARKLLDGTKVPGVDPAAVLASLADKIRADRKHKAALEAVLRAQLDAVLISDLSAALSTARALAAAKGGAVRLLAAEVPESEKSKDLSENPPDLPGEPLLPYVKASAPLVPLLGRLLGRVWLTDAASLETVVSGASEGVSQWTFVTPEGIVLRPGGAVELWSPKAGESNPMDLAHQLAEWQDDLAKQKVALEEAKKAVADLEKAESDAHAAIAAATSALDTHRRDLALVEGELNTVNREARQARQRVETITWELDALEKKTASGTKRRAELQATLEDLRTRMADNRARSETAAQSLRELEERRTAFVDAATEARVALSALQQRRESLKALSAPLDARIRELETLIAERSAGVDSYRARIASLAAAAEEAQARIASLETDARARKEDLDAARARRESCQSELAQRDEILRTERTELDNARTARSDADMAIAKHSMHRQNMLDRLAADYQAGPDEIKAASEPAWAADAPAPTPAVLETMVSDLRARLAEMGPVNLVAIEENQELEERYAFLNQQNDDLTKAKTQLTDLIRKINSTTTSLFKETFEKVNANFQELFKKLFGGGSANLVLIDEANVLESGIEIIARPPGKKPQTVSLLSGGERTLTALSLLFALFRVKPSAFCLTDELDAALDDSNIARYLSMLDDFLPFTQFLVITHNRQTIAKASALYGVTMEKRGISKFVSMKFRDGQADAPDDAVTGSTGAPVRTPAPKGKPQKRK